MMFKFYRTYTTPFKATIPADLQTHFANTPVYKRFRRFFLRYLYKNIALFNNKELTNITDEHKEILWIHLVDPYLGDSLMDLSSRILLQGKQVDLLTQTNVADIYKQDSIFNFVFTDPNECDANQYDVMIIDSYRHRGLRIVKKYLSSLPYVSLYGYYGGHNLNRTLFSFFRLNQLLFNPCNEQHIYDTAKPLLSISREDKQIVGHTKLTGDFITIAIGGREQNRIFNSWDKIVRAILAKELTTKIVLVGLQNASKESQIISKNYASNIINLVGQYSFTQSAYIIQKSQVLLCCDGGLMHAANAVGTPIIALFCSHVKPEMRITGESKDYALYDKYCVNNISTSNILKKFELLLDAINTK